MYGVRVAGTIHDARRVAAIASPVVGASEDAVAAQIDASGHIAHRAERADAQAIVESLGAIGLEVFVEPISASKKVQTDPLHGLAQLSRTAALPAPDRPQRPVVFGTEPPEPIGPVDEGPLEIDAPIIRNSGELRALTPPAASRRLDTPLPEPSFPPPKVSTEAIEVPSRDPFEAPDAPSQTAPSPRSSDVEPAPPGRGRGLLLMLAALVVIAATAWWLLRGPGVHETLAAARSAAQEGRYAEALALSAQARSAGADDSLVTPIERGAQAGPLLDSARAHLEAERWAEASAALDAAAAIASDAPQLGSLLLRLKKGRRAASTRVVVPRPPSAPASAAGTSDAPSPAVATTAPASKASTATVAPSAAPPSAASHNAATPVADEPPTPDSKGAQPGRLRVTAPRPARIEVDGKRTRHITPATLRLPAGTHRITLKDLKTNQPISTRTIRVAAGRRASVRFAERAKPSVPAAPTTRRVDLIGLPARPSSSPPARRRIELLKR